MAHLEIETVKKHCPICAEFRYISLVKICPICGAPGKLQEVKNAAEDYLRRFEFQALWETGTLSKCGTRLLPSLERTLGVSS